jgi:hypothetical protein
MEESKLIKSVFLCIQTHVDVLFYYLFAEKMYHKGGDGKSKGFGFPGFALGSSKKDEHSIGTEMAGLGGMPQNTASKFMPGRSFGYHTNIGKKRATNEDE